MTSKNLFPELLRENRKRRLWPLALSILAAIFSLPVFAILMMENWSERMSYGGTSLQEIRLSFYNTVAGAGNIPVFLCTVTLAVILGINSMTYLHSKGKTDLYGSLPVKRTDLFGAAYLNGLLFFAIPFFAAQVITVILGAVRGMYVVSSVPGTLLSSAYVMILYFSIYTLCCLASVLSGNTLVSTALSGVILFVVPLGYAAYSAYAHVFFRNHYSDTESVVWRYLSPVFYYIWLCSEKAAGEFEKTGIESVFKIIPGVLIMLIVGIIALVLLFALIKKRPSESAGQALAFKWTRPILKIILMVVGTLLIAVGFYEISPLQGTGWLIFGFIAGSVLIHAVVEIICEFDFKACLRHPVSFITGTVLSALLILAFMFDVFGYDSYIPPAASVESAAVTCYDFQPTITYNDIEDRGYYIGSEEYRLKKMELHCIEDVNVLAKKGVEFSDRIHKDTLLSFMGNHYDRYGDFVDEGSSDYRNIVVRYRLITGGNVYRSYRIDMNDDQVFDAYSRIFDTMEYKEAVYPVLKAGVSELGRLRFNDQTSSVILKLDEKDRGKLLRCYRQDMTGFEGKKLREEIPCAQIISTKGNIREKEYDLVIYPSFERTLGFLEEVKGRDDLKYGYVESVDVTRYDPDTGYYDDDQRTCEDPKEIEEILSLTVRSEFFREADVFMEDLEENKEGYSIEAFFSADPSDMEAYAYSASYILPEGKVMELPGFD